MDISFWYIVRHYWLWIMAVVLSGAIVGAYIGWSAGDMDVTTVVVKAPYSAAVAAKSPQFAMGAFGFRPSSAELTNYMTNVHVFKVDDDLSSLLFKGFDQDFVIKVIDALEAKMRDGSIRLLRPLDEAGLLLAPPSVSVAPALPPFGAAAAGGVVAFYFGFLLVLAFEAFRRLRAKQKPELDEFNASRSGS